MDPRVEQAQRLLDEGKEYEARVLLQTILEVDPQNTDALFACLYLTKSSQQAEALLRRVLEINPDHNEARSAYDKLLQRKHSDSVYAQLIERRDGIGMIVLLVAAAIFIIAFMTIFPTGDNSKAHTDTASVNVQHISSSTSIPSTQRPRSPTLQSTDLPSTWTALPPATQAPTNTHAPTITPRPTQTILPTFTPTAIEVARVQPNLANYGRLYVTYTELSAQSSWLKDPDALQKIQDGFLALIMSFELSGYDTNHMLEEATDFVGNFIRLLHDSHDLTLARKELTLVEQECTQSSESISCEIQLAEAQTKVEELRLEWLEQDDVTGRILTQMRREATMSAALGGGLINALTPVSTVILVETMPPFMPTAIPDDGG